MGELTLTSGGVDHTFDFVGNFTKGSFSINPNAGAYTAITRK
jgi:hypothetical protein